MDDLPCPPLSVKHCCLTDVQGEVSMVLFVCDNRHFLSRIPSLCVYQGGRVCGQCFSSVVRRSQRHSSSNRVGIGRVALTVGSMLVGNLTVPVCRDWPFVECCFGPNFYSHKMTHVHRHKNCEREREGESDRERATQLLEKRGAQTAAILADTKPSLWKRQHQ